MSEIETGIDVFDRDGWNDYTLVNDWNTALVEYELYHSIHKEGRRLEDVITPEELTELQVEYADVLEVEAKDDAYDQGTDNYAADMAISGASEAEPIRGFVGTVREEDPSPSEQRETNGAPETPAATHNVAQMGHMPAAVLGAVRDESLKNLMMSWFYAGYYTGLNEGQQKASGTKGS